LQKESLPGPQTIAVQAQAPTRAVFYASIDPDQNKPRVSHSFDPAELSQFGEQK
jgi:hypothetical protein